MPETIEISLDVPVEEAVATLARHAQSSSWEHVKLDLLSKESFYHVHIKPNGRFKIQAAPRSHWTAPPSSWHGMWFALKGQIAASGSGSLLKARIAPSTAMLSIRWPVTLGLLSTGLGAASEGDVRTLLVVLSMAALLFAALYFLHRSCYGRAREMYVGFLEGVYAEALAHDDGAGDTENSGSATG